MNRFGRMVLIFMSMTILASCGGTVNKAQTTSTSETTASETTAPETTAPETTASTTAPEAKTVDPLALCITEGGLPLTEETIDKRFADYVEMGITCVRIDTYWDTSERGVWRMSEVTKWHLEAARKYGLTLKLILPTVMGPPAWLFEDVNTRLADRYGRLSYNTVSYWYEGIYQYSDMALRAQLSAIVDGGYTNLIGGIVVDMGPAGEPLYPPAWTQPASEVEGEVMWCYGENAQADFRAKMEQKYGDIEALNRMWKTYYESFSEISVPYEGEVGKKFWEDTMEWYRDTKREFCKKQVDVFAAALSDFGIADCPLILYLPGADVSEEEWDANIKNKSASHGMKLGCDNQFMADLAKEKGCRLQYTGINDTEKLAILVDYMTQNAIDVPVYGENAGGNGEFPQTLGYIVRKHGLAGIDYTHARWIYDEADGVTKNKRYGEFAEALKDIKKYLTR
ncbi:MAG: family 14 glycosylhydrolase [Clostridia bacterium]|nr:family 14 glycosylhydrolase [Clostridia bacterium]